MHPIPPEKSKCDSYKSTWRPTPALTRAKGPSNDRDDREDSEKNNPPGRFIDQIVVERNVITVTKVPGSATLRTASRGR